MLRFENELRKKDLIFPFVHQEPAHCAVFCISICVRKYESKFKQAMTVRKKVERRRRSSSSHTELGLEVIECWQNFWACTQDCLH